MEKTSTTGSFGGEKEVSDVVDKIEADFAEEKIKKVRDVKTKSTIVQCITEKHLNILKDAKTAQETMKALKAEFERKSVFSKLTLKKKLFTLKCGHDEKLEDHFELERVG